MNPLNKMSSHELNILLENTKEQITLLIHEIAQSKNISSNVAKIKQLDQALFSIQEQLNNRN